ncbi:MAG: DUF5119 domain-containing protein [Alistipes sp.]|nr:DUF5119 domain-containing protein [Alistipes sp.]
MKRLMRYAALALLLLSAAGCHRRPLVDIENTHYVRVYIDEELLNVTTGFYDQNNRRPEYATPTVMRVALFDPSTGKVAGERYLRGSGRDERGAFCDGYISADPGDYCLLTYNFGTESTVLRRESDYGSVEAYTNDIAAHLYNYLPSRADADDSERIVYDPDHLFVDGCQRVHIPARNYVDTLRNEQGDYFTARSVVKSYYLQIRVKGMQYASTAVSLLTGMAGSTILHDRGVRSDNPATIYFEMNRSDDRSARSDDLTTIYTTFGTFGKLPDHDNRLEVAFDFITVDGRALSATIDITDKFSEPDAVEHQWILLDEIIEIPEPVNSGGGFTPGVGDWGDINTDIII